MFILCPYTVLWAEQCICCCHGNIQCSSRVMVCPGVRAYPGDDCTVLCVLLMLGWVLSEVGGGGRGEGALAH